MKKHGILLTLALVMLLGFCTQAVPTTALAAGSNGETKETKAYTGWKTKNGSKYYYVDGKKVTSSWMTIKGSKYYFKGAGKMATNWTKISGKKYYFGSNGKLRTNQIAGTSKTGIYYVDADGVRVTDSVMKKAVSFVMSNSKSSQSSLKRLESCYKKMAKYSYIRYYGDKPSASEMPTYANDLFKKEGGNCYRFSSAMAYVARALGYDSRVACGAIDSSNNGTFSAHSWTEVKIDGKWKIIDVTQNMHGRGYFFNVKNSYYKQLNMTLRCDDRYKLTVNKGKVEWS